LESTGERRNYAIIEKLIADLGKKRVSVISQDVSLRDLESFLARRCGNINSFDKDFSLEYLQDSELRFVSDVFDQEITESLTKATESFWRRDYPGALRDLRAVVQDTLELVAERHAIDLTGITNPNIKIIAHKLAEEKVLEEDFLYGSIALLRSLTMLRTAIFLAKRIGRILRSGQGYWLPSSSDDNFSLN